MARHALLIGVSEFADERLARLNAPTNDVMALRGILQDSSRGSFDGVELSLNEDFLAVRDHLSNFFNDRAPDDVLLIYYSGHGILGRGNRLFLATGGSNLDTPFTRSISAQEIRDFIEYSRAQRQIVVLDCCHSGAFAEHAKAAVPPPAVTRATFSSSDAGTYVLTAADTLQFAWDGTELRAGNEAAAGFSQFTSWLVEGLEKGEAAPDDEQITMDALYRYLSRRARSEGSAATPQRFVQGGVGDLVISANPLMGASQIDPGVLAALASEEFRTRLGAVAELTLQMEEVRTVAARAARRLVERHLPRERDYQVRRAIMRALEGSNGPSEAARQAEEEERQAKEDERRAEAGWQAEQEKQRAEMARQAEEEKQRAETARQAEEEEQRAETARQAEEEEQRAETARQAEEEEHRAEAARQAEEEKQQAETAQQAEEKQRAEAARQGRAEAMLAENRRVRLGYSLSAGEEKQQAEAARLAEEEKRRTGAAGPPANKLSWDQTVRAQTRLSVIGAAPAFLALLIPPYGAGHEFSLLVIALSVSATFFAIRPERKSLAYMLAAINPLLAAFATFLLARSFIDGWPPQYVVVWALVALAFSIEGVAAFLNIRKRRSLEWKQLDERGGVTSLWDQRRRTPITLSIIGVVLALISALIQQHWADAVFVELVVVLLASATFLAIQSELDSTAYFFAAINPLLAVFSVSLLVEYGSNWGLISLTFTIESVAAILDVRWRRQKQPERDYRMRDATVNPHMG
jgi:hypothetical protein